MSFLDTLRFLGFPEEIEGELYFWPTPPKCAVCRGDLLRSEVRFGSCGDCGGRSISRRDVSASHSDPRPGELLGQHHAFLPVRGHPDDDECTYRSDGTDDTYCGLPETDHQLPGGWL